MPRLLALINYFCKLTVKNGFLAVFLTLARLFLAGLNPAYQVLSVTTLAVNALPFACFVVLVNCSLFFFSVTE
jgi:hypothetical protein